MSAELELACAARADYLAHCATMLASVLARRREPMTVHLLVGDDVDAADLAALEAMLADGGARLSPVRVEGAELAGLPVSDALPVSHWYRVLLPHLLPGRPRVLYVDCDVLAADDPGPLFEVDLEGKPLGAVANVFPDPDSGAKYAAAIGTPGPEAYFNSGVLVLDLEEMRRREVPRRVLEHGRRHPDRGFLHEQDAVNAVLAGDWRALHPRWNVMHGLRRFPWAADLLGREAVAEALAHPGLLHFEGGGANKPWHPEADAADRELYARARALTPWPRVGAGPAGA